MLDKGYPAQLVFVQHTLTDPKLIGDQIGPDVVSSLGNLTGESEQVASSAINAAVPTLIGLMSKQGASSSGAGQLLDLMNNQPAGMDVAGNFLGLLGDDTQRNAMSTAGNGILSSLMGGGSTSGVLDLITKTAGLKSGSSSMLMSLIAPFVIGMIKNKLMGGGGGGLNAGSLMGLLGGQSQFLKSSAPSGLTDLLGVSNFADLGGSVGSSATAAIGDQVGAVGDAVGAAGDRVGDAVGGAAARVDHAVDGAADRVEAGAAKASGGLPRWLLPLVGLLALLAILFYACGGRGAPDMPSVDLPAMPAVVCDNVGGLTDTIGGLPEITADTETSVLSDGLGKVTGVLGMIAGAGVEVPGLSAVEDAVGTIEGLIGSAGDTLGDASDQVGEAVGGLQTAGESFAGGISCN